MRMAAPIPLTEEECKTLQKWAQGRSTAVRLMIRSQIVLLAAKGKPNMEIASELGVSRKMVGLWRARFAGNRLAGIEKDAPRGGRKPSKREQLAPLIIRKTTQEKPKHATHWSVRTLAAELGIDPTMVYRVWKANHLKPHLVRTFKLSQDPHFVEKVVDVVGLYLNPPEHALVLSVDEKTSIQALDRTQPSLPMIPGRAGTLTHDYQRNGTTTLFAALEIAEGKIIGACMQNHRHQEWIKFLKIIDENTPPQLDLHLIVDNYATHKHPNVKKWLKRHSRFHLHFIPTSSSWLNLVERWFREITVKRIRRGAFRSVEELKTAILSYIDRHNELGESFSWTAKADEIFEKVKRAKAVLDKTPTG
jgi:transposase/DNA-binding CsgD family transcriptional regulator